MGVGFRNAFQVFEVAVRSLFGPAAMRVDGPEERTIYLLELVGADTQNEEYLQLLVKGDTTSTFSMTEPLRGQFRFEDDQDHGRMRPRRVGD